MRETLRTTLLATIFALLCVPLENANAQLMPRTSLSMEAKVVSSGSGARTTDTGYASMTRDYSSITELDVRIRNLGKQEAKCELEWYFVAKDLKFGRKYVHTKGTKELTVPAGGWVKEALLSDAVEGFREKGWSYEYKSGSKFDGWILLLKEGGVVVRVEASSHPYKDLAIKPDELAKLLKATSRE